MKLCSKCKESKPYTEFHKSGSSKSGLESRCKPCRNIGSKASYDANKQNISARRKLNRSDSHREWNRNYQREKRKSLVNKISHRISALIRYSLKGNKSTTTRKIVGLDSEKLMHYLEYTYFLNYGIEYTDQEFEIDHIVPVSLAGSIEEVIRLNHYTNLQMLTPEDNKRKSNNYKI